MSYRYLLHRILALAVAVCFFPRFACAKQQDDIIRVLLTRFGSPAEISVNISGSYSCGDIHFQRGMTVRLAAGTSKNQILLRYEGLTVSHSGPLTLTRHQTKEENGLRLQGSLNLYTGDLTVSNRDGQLRMILSVPLEEYLLGVLPWEMSAGFPLEALKAQAVAARTYALTRRDASRDYDVYDNTNDQVYAGISDNAPIIRKAVSATEGICVLYKKQPVTCYYTASNGGLVESIESAWGKKNGPTGYIQSKTDPYDLDNDESVVRQAAVPADLTEEEFPALYQFLTEAAAKPLKRLGYSERPEDIRLRKIVGITIAESKDSKPQSLTFQLNVDAVRTDDPGEDDISFIDNAPFDQAGTPAGGRSFYSLSNPIEVTLPIFPDIETALQLSINTAANEVWSLKTGRDSFILEARRFGHGVGMSQRGAQRMAAAFGWNYKQILLFYYHDVTLEHVSMNAVTPLPADAFTFDATPGPKPTATPRPTLMPVTLKANSSERLVQVDGVAEDSSLNLRAKPDTASEILARLYYGQKLAVLDESGDWLHVRTDVLEGYVMEKFVSPVIQPD
ncbi:MAG: SpoIID/LytB domain-containing protein [Clostridia bacterium]|nr:SpoIID/LytB domain-containing protein [Clostridia bacterium]